MCHLCELRCCLINNAFGRKCSVVIERETRGLEYVPVIKFMEAQGGVWGGGGWLGWRRNVVLYAQLLLRANPKKVRKAFSMRKLYKPFSMGTTVKRRTEIFLGSPYLSNMARTIID